MKYNKEYNINEIIKINKTKFQFIGFIVGIVPFLIMLGIISIKQGGTQFIPSIFRDTLIIAGLITAIINSIILKNMFINKIEASSKN